MPEERKLVTILFADIVGSTSLTGTHDAEVVQAAMDAAFDRIAPVIRAHGGTVEKFIGDAVMSVFGFPAAHDDDAERAVRTAFAIRDAIAGAGGPLPLEVRVGVNTGEAVTRTDGADQRMVTGMAVNVAQRLQSAAQPGEILVGGVTRDLTKGAVRYAAPRAVQAKGIGEMAAFAATTLLDAVPEQHRGLEGMRARIIGRDRELRILTEIYARTRETRESHLVTVYGAAGAGKSRLVAEFARAAGEQGVRSGRCLPYGEGITYYPLQLILREDAGIEPQDTRETATGKLLAAVTGAVDADEVEPIFDRLCVLAGLAQVNEALAAVPQDQISEELRWGFRRYVERRAAAEPLVIVFEDVHWAEPTLLDLIESLAESARGPICMVCLARPDLKDARPTWGASAANATTIALSPLSPEDTRQLVAELLAIDALPEEIRTAVIARAEGNPLYVEEFLRMLMDTGRIEQREGRWVAVQGGDVIGVPPTLVGLISARLDHVSPDVKRLLQRGSLAGRIFSVTTLAVLGDGAAPDAHLLREAVRRDLLVEADERAIGGGRVYRFKHVLIRDVVYGSLPKAERSRLHDCYGRWLEESLGERSAEVLEIVAHHAEQAHLLARELGGTEAEALGLRAFDLLFRAGHAASERDDAPAAEGLFGRADSVGRTTPVPPSDWLDARGSLAIYRYFRDPTAEHVEQLDAITGEARSAGPSRILAQLCLATAWHLHNNTDRTVEAAELNGEALTVARDANDGRSTASALLQRGVFGYWTGDLAASRAALTDALVHFEEQQVEREHSSCHFWLRMVFVQQGDFSEGARQNEAALRSLAARRSQVARLLVGLYAGEFAMLVGDYEGGVRALSEARALVHEVGRFGPMVSWRVSWRLGEVLLRAGDPAAAIGRADEAVSAFESRRQFGQLPMAQAVAAIARARSGDATGARALVEAARAVVLSYDWLAKAWVERADAESCEAEGCPERAPALFERAVELIPAPFQYDHHDIGVDFARFLVRQRRPAEARPLLEAARDFYRDPAAFRLRAEVEQLLRQCDEVRA